MRVFQDLKNASLNLFFGTFCKQNLGGTYQSYSFVVVLISHFLNFSLKLLGVRGSNEFAWLPMVYIFLVFGTYCTLRTLYTWDGRLRLKLVLIQDTDYLVGDYLMSQWPIQGSKGNSIYHGIPCNLSSSQKTIRFDLKRPQKTIWLK